MFYNFDDLRTNMNIPLDPEHADAHHLEKLKQWVYDNVSADIDYQGETQIQYRKYSDLSRQYLDEFLVKTTKEIRGLLLFEDMSVIQYAAKRGYHHYLKSLTSSGIDWSQGDARGMTLLHWAALQGFVNTTKILLEKGANPSALSKEHKLPLDSSLFIPALYDNRLIENKKIIFYLLLPSTPGALSNKDVDGNTLLHRIALHDLSDLAEQVLKKNITLARVINLLGDSPLHTAISNRSDNAASVLIQSDPVIVMLPNSKMQTAIHYAATSGSLALLELCCNNTKNLNIADRGGKTALMLAHEAGHTDAARLLLSKGAKDCVGIEVQPKF
jgi:ankyrin repeat protein